MEKILASAGLYLERDAVGVAHIRFDQQLSFRAKRFTKFQQFILESVAQHPEWIGCCLVCFDAVVGEDALHKAAISLSQAYRIDEGICIEWEQGQLSNAQLEQQERIDRRYLSVFTVLALSEIHSQSSDAGEFCRLISQAIDQGLESFHLYASESDPRQEMWADAACWYVMHFPAALASHILGLQVMSALPRSVLARKQTGMVIAAESFELAVPDLDPLPAALDAVLESAGSDTDATVINVLKETLKRTPGLNPSQQRKKWLTALSGFILEAQRVGPVSALILAWTIDLVSKGTRNKSDLAIATIQRYVRPIIFALWDVFRKCTTTVDELQAHDFDALYQAVWNHRTLTQSLPSKQAIYAWHSFLIQEFEAPRLYIKFIGKDLQPAVDAQCIWLHEKQRVLNLLARLEGNERLAQQCSVFFLIACNGAFRQDEVARLRMANIRIGSAGVDIEVVASGLHGRLKTASAQRRVHISDTDACRSINEWLERRRLEGASLAALFFGDPQSVNPKVYLRYQTASSINKALKIATGESGASIHGLRHTFLSERASDLFMSSSCTGINRYWDLANDAGHASPITTLTSYSHLFEAGIRLHADCAIRSDLQWDSTLAAKLLGVKPDKLRQQKHRAKGQGKELYDIVCCELSKTLVALKLPTAAEGLQLQEYGSAQLVASRENFGIPQVLLVIDELIEQRSKESICLRYQIAESEVDAIEQSALIVCEKLMRHVQRTERGGISKEFARSCLKTACLFLDLNLKKRNQRKYEDFAFFISSVIDEKLILSAASSWMKCYRGRYLSIDAVNDAIDMLRIFALAKVSSKTIQIRLQHQFKPENLKIVWESYFGETPYIKSCKNRSDRPKAYLVWINSECAVTSASSDVQGVSAWLFGLAVWSCYKEKGGFNA